jgi:diaminopimelate decarboxylase
MDHFHYREGVYHAEDVSLAALAEQFGTPCYVYSRATLERHWKAFDQALASRAHLICYAVKANSNLAVLNLLARLGSGFDIVSGGELERVLRAGGEPGKIVFSGVGKREAEIRRALELGIHCFNVESAPELRRLDRIAGELHRKAPISLRVNPDVDAKTHPYISTGMKENKFGIDVDSALAVYQEAAALPNIEIIGVDCHIGSQLTEIAPFLAALERVMALIARLREVGIELKHIDLGGGLGVRYRDEQPPLPGEYAAALEQVLGEADYTILLEPGRAIVANAGVLLSKVEYLKHTPHKQFAVVDAAMNDLIRPALYQAWQEILPVQPRYDTPPRTYDVVGPVCETGDFLGRERSLAVCEGDLLAVRSAGAYGFVMSSNYNSRPRVPEILVDGMHVHLARRRETLDDLLALENPLPD